MRSTEGVIFVNTVSTKSKSFDVYIISISDSIWHLLEMFLNYIINIWRGSCCRVRIGLYIVYSAVLQCCDLHCRSEADSSGVNEVREGCTPWTPLVFWVLHTEMTIVLHQAGVYEPMMLNWYVAMCLFWYSKFREFVLIFNFELIKWKHGEGAEDWWKRTCRVQYPLLLLIVGNNSSGTNWR
jgi:hypothetical protein